MAVENAKPELLIDSCRSMARLVLNRPEKGNALNASLVEQILDAIEAANRDEARLVTVEGQGASFCTGFDLTAIENESDASLAYRFLRIETLLQAINHAPFETLALAHGRVFGAGADLVNACSRRIAAPGTLFRMPGLAFGIVLGTRRFIQCAGEVGRTILAENRSFDASEALAINFIHQIVDRADWPRLTDETLERARRLPPESSRLLIKVAHPEHRDSDMGILARSATQPGLKQRMMAYRDTVQKQRRQKQ